MNFAKPTSLGYLHSLDDLDISAFNPKRWIVEAKYNGWRTKVGKTGLPISKNDNQLDYRGNFDWTVDLLRTYIDWDFCDYVDCEFMTLTPMSCPVGTIIAYDCMGGESVNYSQGERTQFMWKRVPNTFDTVSTVCVPEAFDSDYDELSMRLKQMLEFNERNDLLYEGFVFKKLSARYGQNRAWYKLRFQEQLIKNN